MGRSVALFMMPQLDRAILISGVHLYLFVFTYQQIVLKSLKMSGALLVIDFLASFLLRNYLYPFEVLGDLLLVETAVLFLTAGIIDFGSSLGFVQFKKTMGSSKEPFSAEKRKEMERRALVFVVSGSTLLGFLVLFALLTA